MKLSHVTSGTGTAISFLHGFTQTKESWLPVVEQLPIGHQYTCIDAPGHGGSLDGKRSLVDAGNDVAETMSQGILVGYSMGARIALHTALQHPAKVKALVLISGTAGIDDENERVLRRESDEALANRISEIGVPAFVDEWLSNPMFSGLSPALADVPSRCQNTAEGLGDSLRFAGTGTQTPLWNDLHTLAMPVLLIAGENDQKFVDLAQRMNSSIPNSELHVISGVGHTCHLEDIAAFTAIFQEWLSRI